MKKILGRIVNNAVKSPASSILGGCVGYEDIVIGLQTHNYYLLVKGLIIVLAGLLMNENQVKEEK